MTSKVDITTAFLNGDLEEGVFMSQPEGFVDKDKEHLAQKESVWTQAVASVLEFRPRQVSQGN